MVALLMMVWYVVTLLHVSHLLSHSLFPPILPYPLPSRSICLMLQAALPCLLFAPETSRLVLRGGTNADMAPPIDYVVQVGCLHPILLESPLNVALSFGPTCWLLLQYAHGLKCSKPSQLPSGAAASDWQTGSKV